MEKENKSQVREFYITPVIEIADIETEKNILAGGCGEAPALEGEDWYQP